MKKCIKEATPNTVMAVAVKRSAGSNVNCWRYSSTTGVEGLQGCQIPTLGESTQKYFTCTKQYHSFFFCLLSCKRRALITSRNYGITPTHVDALLQSLIQEQQSVTCWNQVQTLYTCRCTNISSLAPVVLWIISLCRVELNTLQSYPYLPYRRSQAMHKLYFSERQSIEGVTWHESDLWGLG